MCTHGKYSREAKIIPPWKYNGKSAQIISNCFHTAVFSQLQIKAIDTSTDEEESAVIYAMLYSATVLTLFQFLTLFCASVRCQGIYSPPC